MRRDMDLIRLLLQHEEGEEPKPDLSRYTNAQIFYHYQLMLDAGLVEAEFLRDGSGEVVGVSFSRLTNQGHDFLAASRSDTVWKKFGQAMIKVGGSVSIPVAMELLKQIVKAELGL